MVSPMIDKENNENSILELISVLLVVPRGLYFMTLETKLNVMDT